MIVLETDRLNLRFLVAEDSAFVLELLNEPAWLQFIGDRNIRTLDGARTYIAKAVAMYERFGFGLYVVERKSDAEPLGLCGLIKRETLADVDIGFAFLARYWGNGYAYESASAVVKYGRSAFDLPRIVAITTSGNAASIRLLAKIGLHFEQSIQLEDGGVTLSLYASGSS
ncbi:MAG: GNAT family N-acetyltransferase [Candidatus Baltobacteraceae bacterium]